MEQLALFHRKISQYVNIICRKALYVKDSQQFELAGKTRSYDKNGGAYFAITSNLSSGQEGKLSQKTVPHRLRHASVC